jgi:hypothetical protein
MKLVGFLMVVFGFVVAALASVVDENAIKWLWYIPALALGTAGVAVIRTDEARRSKTEHHVTAKIETINGSIGRIVANINKLNSEKHSINTYDMRHRIDELFIKDLEMFVDARESIGHRYGLAAYGPHPPMAISMRSILISKKHANSSPIASTKSNPVKPFDYIIASDPKNRAVVFCLIIKNYADKQTLLC